jgi:pyruvate dehydrogenase E1 component beta subunit
VIKTGRLVTVEDDYPQHGVGSELVAIVHETKAFDYMKGPVQRVTAIDVPMPYAKLLEDSVTPKSDSIIKAVKKALKYK